MKWRNEIARLKQADYEIEEGKMMSAYEIQTIIDFKGDEWIGKAIRIDFEHKPSEVYHTREMDLDKKQMKVGRLVHASYFDKTLYHIADEILGLSIPTDVTLIRGE